ncbi:MAG: hypothetical protein HYV97_00040 [Bdellovibrio sp.]|nr:hypothetical protein [Bdellovibrio sp.]
MTDIHSEIEIIHALTPSTDLLSPAQKKEYGQGSSGLDAMMNAAEKLAQKELAMMIEGHPTQKLLSSLIRILWASQRCHFRTSHEKSATSSGDGKSWPIFI